MVRRVVVAMDVPGASPEACFDLASAAWVYEAVHVPAGDMLDVLSGDWAAPGAAALPKRAAGGGGLFGRPRSAPEPAPDAAPAGPGLLEAAERVMQYRVPPHFADGWLAKLCPSLTIVERHARAPRASSASGGRVAVTNSVRWSRLAPPAHVMAYTFDVAPVRDVGGREGVPGTRIVYAAEIEVRVPVPIPARARAAIEDSMVDSFDVMCDRFIRYAAARVGGGEPVPVRGVSGGGSAAGGDDDDGDGDRDAVADLPTTPRTPRPASAGAAGFGRGSMDGPPLTPGGRRRVSHDLKGGTVFVEGDLFYDAREE